ncbi:MAG: UDP-N-acetylglucosamine--N-acetylmuramyl-(pentapeptide) pyrophosphoryl-undecaprenol N-acetylglucosamine transferase [Phycisphaerales bacterium]|nr:UDP-N-acetylglucosamine--N-acetylmuramyl-(pentapeptide) pyrophosphoryl-undecaprenol N-acetylglucosamine transferase [Phycisphaerales bacterium]
MPALHTDHPASAAPADRPVAPERPVIAVFVGGGTGGHLYPGIAIAERLHEHHPGTRCVFVCSDRAVDKAVLTGAGVNESDFVPIGARPVVLRPRGLVNFLRSWGPSVRACRALYRELGKTNGARLVVVAMGGFVAAPAVQAARAEGLPVLMVNLDAEPGKANRWIAGRCQRALSVFPVQHGYARGWRVVPPIVRSGAALNLDPRECKRRLGLDPERPVLMITGGSLGAGSINRLMQTLLKDSTSCLRTHAWQVLHQCGETNDRGGSGDAVLGVDDLRRAYKLAGVPARVEPLVKEMGLWWGSAELALSRAGAGAVAEAWANRVPTVFLPYPYHKDQHQKLNAQRLGEGAVVAMDLIEPEANVRDIGPILGELMANAGRRTEMRSALERLGPADGAGAAALEGLRMADSGARNGGRR